MVSQNGPEVLTTQDKEHTKEYKKISAQSKKLENIKTRLNKVDKLNEQESKEIEKELNNVDTEIDSLLQEMDRDTKSNFESEISHVEGLYQSVNTLLEKKVKEELSVLEKSVKRTKNNWGKVAVGVGTFLGIRWLWKKIKGKEETKSDTKKEKGFFSKAKNWVLGIGASVGAFFGGKWIYKNWGKVKSWFSFESGDVKKLKEELFKNLFETNKDKFRDGVNYNPSTGNIEYKGESTHFTNVSSFTDKNLNERITISNINNRLDNIDKDLLENTNLKEANETLEKNPTLNKLGTKINDFHGNLLLDAGLGDSEIDKNKPGLVLAQLDNMGMNVGKLLGKGSYDILLDKTSLGLLEQGIDFVWGLGKEATAWFVGLIASQIPNLDVPFLGDISSMTKEGLLKWVASLTQEQKDSFKDNASLIFTKWMGVSTYLDSVKNKYQYNLAKQVLLQEDSSFVKLDEEDKQEKIFEKLEDVSFVSQYITGKLKTFDKLSLVELSKVDDELMLDALDNPMIDNSLVDTLEKTQETESELLDDLEDANTDAEIKEVADNLLKDIDDVGCNTWYAGFQTLVNSAFNTDAHKIHQQAEGQYATIMQGTKDKINEIKNKETLTESDKEELEELIKGYTKTKQAMLLAGEHKSETTDECFWSRYVVPVWTGTKKQFAYFEGEWAAGSVGGIVLASAMLDVTSLPIRYGASFLVNEKLSRVVRFCPTQKVVKLSGKALGWTLNKTVIGRPVVRGIDRVSSFLRGVNFYKSFGDNANKVLAYDLVHGRVSSKRAMELLSKMSGNLGNSYKMYGKLFGVSDAEAKLIEKVYKQNPKLLQAVLDQQKLSNGVWTKITNKIHSNYSLAKKGSLNFDINTKNLKVIDEIQDSGDALTKGILNNISGRHFGKFKELYNAKGLVKMKLSVGEIDDVARVIGNNINKIDSIEDINKIIAHMNSSSKIKNKAVFLNNCLRNMKKLKTNKFSFTAETIKNLKLNEVSQSYARRAVRSLQKGLTPVQNKITNLMKTAPNHMLPGLKAKLSQIKILKNARFESFQALTFGGNSQVLKTLSVNNGGILTKLSGLSDDVLKLIAGAEDATKIKTILRSNGILGVSDDVANQLANTRKVGNIKNLFSYAKNYQGMSKLKQVFTSPGMQYCGKIFGRALGVAGGAFSVLHGVGEYNEGSDLIASGQNIERGELKQEKGIVQGGVGLIASGLVFIPGVGWALALGVASTELLVGAYYDTMDKYSQNYNDLVQKTELYVKQLIVSILHGQNGTDRDWKESFTRGFNSLKKLFQENSYLSIASPVIAELMKIGDVKNLDNMGDKVIDASIKALFYLDEVKKYPYGGINTSNTELMDILAASGITAEYCGQQLDLINTNINNRMNYFNGSFDKKNLVSLDSLKSGKGLSTISSMVNETEFYIQVDDVSNKEDLENYIKRIESKLDKEPYSYFEKMTNDQVLYYYHNMDKLDISSDESLSKNIKVFNNYMNYRAYRGDLQLHEIGVIQNYEVDLSEIDTFFREFVIQPKELLDQDISIEFVKDFVGSHETVSSNMNVSSHALQNALYRIITEIIGNTSISNTKEDIVNFLSEKNNPDAEARYGLYFDKKGRLNINGNGPLDSRLFSRKEHGLKSDWGDLSFNWDEIGKVIDEILIQTKEGDMIDQGSGDKSLNKEIGSLYIKILKEEQDFVNNKSKYKKELISNIKGYSKSAGYVRLPIQDIEIGIKTGLTNISEYLYKVEDGRIKTYPTGGPLNGISV